MRQRLASFLLLFGCLIYGQSPVSATETQAYDTPGAKVEASAPEPFVAVLLPLSSKTLGPVADALKAGINAAASAESDIKLGVHIYPTDEQSEDVLFAYRQAQTDGAKAVIGPLTKPAIAQLAASNLVTLPTLTLNTPENGANPPKLMYSFGFSVESEARQIAQTAFAAGQRKAITVSADAPFSRRIQTAFAGEWKALGGELLLAVSLTNKPNYSQLRASIEEKQPDMIFFALDSRRARMVRPYLGKETPIFATSQTYNGRPKSAANQDLAGVGFIDMPWLLDPEAPNVARYARPAKTLHVDMERMYALGIDVFRLTQNLLKAPNNPAGLDDGVTGRITLGSQHQFVRSGSFTTIGEKTDESE